MRILLSHSRLLLLLLLYFFLKNILPFPLFWLIIHLLSMGKHWNGTIARSANQHCYLREAKKVGVKNQ